MTVVIVDVVTHVVQVPYLKTRDVCTLLGTPQRLIPKAMVTIGTFKTQLRAP